MANGISRLCFGVLVGQVKVLRHVIPIVNLVPPMGTPHFGPEIKLAKSVGVYNEVPAIFFHVTFFVEGEQFTKCFRLSDSVALSFEIAPVFSMRAECFCNVVICPNEFHAQRSCLG